MVSPKVVSTTLECEEILSLGAELSAQTKKFHREQATREAGPGDPYIVLYGGLVVNDPGLPVFDLDVEGKDREEIVELIEAMRKYPQLAEDVAHIEKYHLPK